MKRPLQVLAVCLLALFLIALLVHDVASRRITIAGNVLAGNGEIPVPAVRFWQTWCVRENTTFLELNRIMGAVGASTTSGVPSAIYALPDGRTILYHGGNPLQTKTFAPQTTAAIVTAVAFYASVVLAAGFLILLLCVFYKRKMRSNSTN